MSSRIEQIIDELEEYIENCKPKFLSNTDIIVNREEIDDLIRELRMKTPDEIKRYQKIISNKEAILNDAREKAERLIREATIQTNELISEHEIMQQAYAQANEVVMLATKQAQEILDNATIDANNIRTAAMAYTNEMLGTVEKIVQNTMDTSKARFDDYYNNLSEKLSIVQANIHELAPAEDEEDNDDGNNDEIDVTDFN